MGLEIEEVEIISPRNNSLRIQRNSSSSSIERRNSDINDNNLRYTSLKDIIMFNEGNIFDSNIAIRNELVKRAASVYLQSAALLATRNQNCIVAFWERIKCKTGSWWRLFGGNIIKSCLLPVFRFLNHIGRFPSLP